MAYIRTIPPARADGPLADLYRRFANPDGTVDTVMQVHSLNPESLGAHGALYVQSMHRPSPLSRAEREMLGVVVSRLNGCRYCLHHHAAGLRRLLPEDRRPVVDELMQGRHDRLTPRESAMALYAERLTREPASMNAGHTNALRAAGLSDRVILDVAQVVGYFAYANRIVLGLGAALGTDEGVAGQWPQS